MKIFLPCLLIIVVVAAVPATPLDRLKHREIIQLKEIMNGVNIMKTTLSEQVLSTHVHNVLKNCMGMCKAGDVLNAHEGLKEDKGLLPRQLFAYTKGTNCTNAQKTDTTPLVKLEELLTEIHNCAQKKFLKLV